MKRTTLTVDGVSADEVSEDLLVDLLAVLEEHGLDADGVGIDRRDA